MLTGNETHGRSIITAAVIFAVAVFICVERAGYLFSPEGRFDSCMRILSINQEAYAGFETKRSRQVYCLGLLAKGQLP